MSMALDRSSRRVLGVLAEKELATPNQYPMSVNALTSGCNQKTARDPQMHLREFEVEGVLRSLFVAQWVTNSTPAGGRVVKWKHRLATRLAVEPDELAVVAELFLRGGSATGRFLHYGHAWNEKYGQLVNRSEPVDAVAAGFAAAALATAHNLAPDRLEAEESACVALRATECAFSIGPANRPETPRAKVEVEALRRSVQPTFTGQSESDIVAITNGLRDLTAGVAGDERGLVQAFGVYVTMHLTNYYNRISYDALDVMQKEAPGAVGVFESLLRESGHVCVFNTFGGILLSLIVTAPDTVRLPAMLLRTTPSSSASALVTSTVVRSSRAAAIWLAIVRFQIRS